MKGQQENWMTVVMEKAVKKVWKTKLPQKVKLFAWRLFQDRLTTRCQLASRGIITDDIDKVCVLCNDLLEEFDHIMWNCMYAQQFWQMVLNWLGVDIRLHF